MTATIKDVAKMAEVSISTVSRVINDSKPVSPEARRRVERAIEELGYSPNEVARSLVTKKSNLIGIIVDDIGNSYLAQIIRGIEEVGRMYNYDIVLCSSYGNEEEEIKFIQLLMQKQVEGMILVSEEANINVVKYISNLKLPFVYLNRYYNVLESPTVSIDNQSATKKIMDYLISEGHKDIAYVSREEDNTDISSEKYKVEGYINSMREIGKDSIVIEADGYKVRNGYKVGKDILELINEKKITAVYCCQDEIAIGVINYLYDNNIRVPEDVSVAGYGDIILASIYRPRLTTIREPYYDIGAVAIRRILKELMGEPIEEQAINLPVQLMVRDSVAKL